MLDSLVSLKTCDSSSANVDNIDVIYRQHNGWLIGWLTKKLGCSHNASDLAQDTFVRVISRCDVSQVSQHRPWLLMIAKRLLIDKSRRYKLEQTYLEKLKLWSHELDIAPSSEQLLEAVQTLELIADALEKLSEKSQQAFLLRHIECLTQAEIAAKLGVSVTMVRNYLVQGLVACHQVINDEALG